MAVRQRVPWSIDEVVMRMSSVQSTVINHIMSDISGGINTEKIRAGHIKTTEFIESEGFVTGTTGWHIDGDGNAEFNEVVIRGTLIAGSGSQIGYDKITSATGQADLVIGGSGSIESLDFDPGVAGWQIMGNGNAEFNDVVLRGDVVSSNWDGSDPPNLSAGPDSATAGMAIDAATGRAQFVDALFVGDDLNYVEIDPQIWSSGLGQPRIRLFRSGLDEVEVRISTIGLEISQGSGLIGIRDTAFYQIIAGGGLGVSGGMFSLTHFPATEGIITQTISGGIVAVHSAFQIIDTQAGAATDDLDTIVLFGAGDFTLGTLLVLRTANNARDVVIKHGTGNISTIGSVDVPLTSTAQCIVLMNTGASSWKEIGGHH